MGNILQDNAKHDEPTPDGVLGQIVIRFDANGQAMWRQEGEVPDAQAIYMLEMVKFHYTMQKHMEVMAAQALAQMKKPVLADGTFMHRT